MTKHAKKKDNMIHIENDSIFLIRKNVTSNSILREISFKNKGNGGWELRLGLRSDPRERTGVGGVNTA